MDPTIVLTAVGTVAAIVGTNIGLIGWLRSDLNGAIADLKKDRYEFETELKRDRKDFEIKLEYWQESISKEMKDFHGRLCTEEEKIRHVKPSKEESNVKRATDKKP